MQINNGRRAFTLIELLIIIGIIGILSAITVLVISPSILDKVRVSTAANDQRQLQSAAVLYRTQIGFYPPDTNRGWDPGFAKALPYNLDPGHEGDCATTSPCPGLSKQPLPNWPPDWETLKTRVQNNWQGPYIINWPQNTPWNGKYDYNYWPEGANRGGCPGISPLPVPPGIYIGVQEDYNDQNAIPASAEQLMLDRGLDSDGCLNGESQMLLKKL